MNNKQIANKALGESSIHGLPYLVRGNLHWMERLFWGLIIIFATYTSIDICLNQWKRFRDNPIVYAMELAWGKSNFPYVGVTLCSDYVDQTEFEKVIEDVWNVKNDTEPKAYQYYYEFLKVLLSLRTINLNTLKPYENDANVNKLNFLDILMRLHNKIVPPKELAPKEEEPPPIDENGKKIRPKFNPDIRDKAFASAITEFGLCKTTSQLSKYTNPFGDLKSLKVDSRQYCDIMNECTRKIYPNMNDSVEVFIYLHNVEDVVAPYDQGTILRRSNMDGSLTIELLISLTTAETEVRNVPIAYRKCRYKNENILKYFDTYRPGLCRMECRINWAYQKCGCKPYFYAVAPHIPICDVKGMLCLAKHNWPQVAKCTCFGLCEEVKYIAIQTTLQKDDSTRFERTLIVKLSLPRMAMKRRVVFSTDQLIMSFGGAVGLFLGASFISIYALIFVFFEYIFSNCCARFREKRAKSEEKKRQENMGAVRMVRLY
ncbi:pickpocket 25 [Haematobia irritans]|uniref:pickpocket 25 n=1 Tax=Haematobia irritans TaxID=7368 RepID=UPI003F4FCC4E